MQITAVTKRLKVAFKQAGKAYGRSGEIETGLYPFDEKDVEVGETFQLGADDELVFIRKYEPLGDTSSLTQSPT